MLRLWRRLVKILRQTQEVLGRASGDFVLRIEAAVAAWAVRNARGAGPGKLALWQGACTFSVTVPAGHHTNAKAPDRRPRQRASRQIRI